jgi:hypothetical protein
MLLLSIQNAGQVHREQVVESPREAMDLASEWRNTGES